MPPKECRLGVHIQHLRHVSDAQSADRVLGVGDVFLWHVKASQRRACIGVERLLACFAFETLAAIACAATSGVV
jgi:hypothetical protein